MQGGAGIGSRRSCAPLWAGGAGIGSRRSCAPLWATGLEAFDGIALINAKASDAVLDGTFEMSVVEVFAELTTTGETAMVDVLEGTLGSPIREVVMEVALDEQTAPLGVAKVLGSFGTEGSLKMAAGGDFLEIAVATEVFENTVALVSFVVPK